METEKEFYKYRGRINRVIDGDTIIIDVDLGFSIFSQQVFRLKGINTPEIVGAEKAEGLKAKEFVQKMLPIGKDITVVTFKDKKGKYGRYLADIWYENKVGEYKLNEILLLKGLAEKYK